MSSVTLSEKCIYSLSEKAFDNFCKIIHSEIDDSADLTIFKNSQICELINQLCADMFADEIKEIMSSIDDPYVGIAALDVPESTVFNKKINSVYSVAAVMGIFGNIGKPNIESLNKMPFSIYSASHENGKLLDSKGLTQYPPEVKLGFHNDGLFNNNEIQIPHHIMTYNMYINYRNPGNFKWVPIALWEKADIFINILKEKLVKIRITPNFYFDQTGEIKNSFVDIVEVPICQVNERNERMFFLNGRVLLEDNEPEIVDLCTSMRKSIGENREKIIIPQREQRALFLKNSAGFHARDIFEDPIEGADLTRVFIRAVDLNAKRYYSY